MSEWRIVKEFFRALEKGYTYNILKNGYLIFGILWGIPVPIVTLGIGLYYKGLGPSVNNIITEVVANPVQILFLMHPILFGIVFGAMGTVRFDKEKERLEYEANIVEINKKLKNTNKKLQELDELKDNFLSMVSHELWSPLTTVQGYLTFVKEEKAGPLTSKQKEALEIAEEQVDHLNHLIGELVDISRIEAGKFEVKLACLNIKPVIAKVIDSLRPKVEEKHIVLTNGSTAQIADVVADKQRMFQVLTNLLGNAVKFTPEGGTVSISAREKEDRVEFTVEDDGEGIPQDKIDKIFDKFYQVDSTTMRRYGGCGLGLAITRSIIELHRGNILVESEMGKGSKFFFELEKCKRR